MHTQPFPQKSGDFVAWGNLPGSSLSYELCQYLSKTQKFTLIITEDTSKAIMLEQALTFFQTSKNISHFPDWETLPYDMFSPHQDIISERIACLNQLLLGQTNLLIAPISTLMHVIADYDYIANASFQVKIGDKFDIEKTRQRLQQRGYYNVNQVAEHGEYAIRGSIMDIYPAGVELPFRIELFDDEVESIRTFDPDTQLSIDKITAINLLPAREFPLDDDAITHFREAWRNQFAGNPMHCPVYQQISDGFSAQGIEYYLPLFFDKATTLFDYLPKETEIIRIGQCKVSAEHFWDEVNERYQTGNIDRTRPLLPPEKLFINTQKLFERLNGFDENYFMYVEDSDLCYQAKKRGFKVLYSNKATVQHVGQGSSNRTFAIVNIYKGLLYYSRKNGGKVNYFIVKLMLMIKARLLVLVGRVRNNKYLVDTYTEAMKSL